MMKPGEKEEQVLRKKKDQVVKSIIDYSGRFGSSTRVNINPGSQFYSALFNLRGIFNSLLEPAYKGIIADYKLKQEISALRNRMTHFHFIFTPSQLMHLIDNFLPGLQNYFSSSTVIDYSSSNKFLQLFTNCPNVSPQSPAYKGFVLKHKILYVELLGSLLGDISRFASERKKENRNSHDCDDLHFLIETTIEVVELLILSDDILFARLAKNPIGESEEEFKNKSVADQAKYRIDSANVLCVAPYFPKNIKEWIITNKGFFRRSSAHSFTVVKGREEIIKYSATLCDYFKSFNSASAVETIKNNYQKANIDLSEDNASSLMLESVEKPYYRVDPLDFVDKIPTLGAVQKKGFSAEDIKIFEKALKEKRKQFEKSEASKKAKVPDKATSTNMTP